MNWNGDRVWKPTRWRQPECRRRRRNCSPVSSRGEVHKPNRAVEMTGHGRGGKPKAGFPPRPQPLEIAPRFPHSHRPGEAEGKWKAKTRLPTFPQHGFCYPKSKQKGAPGGRSLRSRLQAHSWMRICCGLTRFASHVFVSAIRNRNFGGFWAGILFTKWTRRRILRQANG